MKRSSSRHVAARTVTVTPPTLGGILFTSIGYENLPEKFKVALDETAQFSHTPYGFPRLTEVCDQLARQVVLKAGGRIEKDEELADVLVIPVREPKPTALEQVWEPGPTANSRFTDSEMEMIPEAAVIDISEAVAQFAPGWQVRDCGKYMDPGLRSEMYGKENILVTHPLTQSVPCTLSRRFQVPEGKRTTLRLILRSLERPDDYPEPFDWVLQVKVDGDTILEKCIGEGESDGVWSAVEADLSEYAGSEINLELTNSADDWANEAGFWAEIGIASE